jgi:hypothetical protein
MFNLQARKFNYCHPNVYMKLFTERFEKHFLPYNRITYRVEWLLLSAILESTAKSAKRLIRKMGVFVRNTTLLKIMERESLPATYSQKYRVLMIAGAPAGHEKRRQILNRSRQFHKQGSHR